MRSSNRYANIAIDRVSDVPFRGPWRIGVVFILAGTGYYVALFLFQWVPVILGSQGWVFMAYIGWLFVLGVVPLLTIGASFVVVAVSKGLPPVRGVIAVVVVGLELFGALPMYFVGTTFISAVP